MEKITITKDDVIKVNNGDREFFNYIYIKFKDLLSKTSATFPYVKQESFTVISRNALTLLFNKVDLGKNYDIAKFIEMNYSKAFKIELRKYASTNLFELIDSYLKMVTENKLNSLVEYLKYLKIDSDLDVCIKIINDYSDIENEIAKIIGDRDSISSEELKSLAKGKILSQFISAYMLKNEIVEINDEEELDIADADEISDEENDISFVSASKVFYNKISKTKLLSAQEEKSLFEEYCNGSEEAFNKLFKSNLGLVKKVASYYSKIMAFDDLFQEGCMGLTKAIERYDLNLGFKFSTYAVFWIRQAITRFIGNNQTAIRKPIHVHELSKKISKVMEEYFAIHGEEASEEKIAELVGCEVTQVRAALYARSDVISLNGEVGEGEKGEKSELGDFVKDESIDLETSVEKEDLKRLIYKLLDESNLNDRQKLILIYRYGIKDGHEYTLEETGEILGITGERVRQLEKKALERIRVNDDSDALVDFTEDPTKSMQFLKENRVGKSRTNSKNLKRLVSKKKALENDGAEKSKLKEEHSKYAPKSTLNPKPQDKEPADFSKVSFGLLNIENKPKAKRPQPQKPIKYDSFNVPAIDVIASSEDNGNKELIEDTEVRVNPEVITEILSEGVSDVKLEEANSVLPNKIKAEDSLEDKSELISEPVVEISQESVTITKGKQDKVVLQDENDNKELVEKPEIKASQEAIIVPNDNRVSEESNNDLTPNIEINVAQGKVLDIGPGKEFYRVKDKHIYKYLEASDEYKYVVIDLLNNIPNDDLRIVRIYCGNLFDGVDASSVLSKEKLRFRKQIVPRLKDGYETLNKLIKGSEDYNNKLIDFRVSYNKCCVLNSKSLLTYLNVTEENRHILDDLLAQLFVTDLELLKLYYGNELDGINAKKIGNYEKNRINGHILPYLSEYFRELLLVDRSSKKYNEILNEFKNLCTKKRMSSKYIFYYFDIPTDKRYVLLDLIYNLSPTDFRLLKVNCGKNFDGKSLRKITTSERNRIYKVIFPRLAIYYELLVNVSREDKLYSEILMKFYKICNEQDKNHLTANIFIYLNIPDDKKEMFFDIVSMFEKEEQDILKENCGENYDGVGGKVLYNSKKEKLYSVIFKLKEELPILVKLERDSIEYKLELAKFRRRLNLHRPINKSSLLEVLNVDPKNRSILEDLLMLLPYFDLEIVIRKYGKNLDGNETLGISEFEQNRLKKTILPDLKKYYNELLFLIADSELYNNKIEEIRKYFEKRIITTNYLFYYLKVPFDKRNIMLDLVTRLPKDDYSILENNCGKNFDGNRIRNLNSKERAHMTQTIFPRLIKYYKMIEGLERESKEYKEILFDFKIEFYKFNSLPLNLFDILEISDDKKDVLLDLLSIFKNKDISHIKEYCGEEYNGIGAINDRGERRNKIFNVYIPYLQNLLYEIYNFERNSDEYQEKLEELKNKYGDIYHSKKNKIYEYFGVPKEKENVLLDILWLLPDEPLGILKEYFGEELNRIKEKPLSEPHKDKIYTVIIPKVQEFYKRLVTIPEKSVEYNKLLDEFAVFFVANKRNTTRNLINFFDNRYSFEELATAIAKISDEELRNLIYRACGPKLNGVGGERIPTAQCASFSRDAIRELKKILEQEEKNKQNDTNVKAGDIINNNQLKEEKEMAKKRKGLLEYFDIPETNRGVILDSLTCLDLDDFAIVKKKFKDSLDGQSDGKLSTAENARFYTTIAIRIREGYQKLVLVKDNLEEYKAVLTELHENWKKRHRLDNLVEYYGNLYTVEEMKSVIKEFAQDEQELIYKICGKDLDGVNNSPATQEERIILGGKIARKLHRRLQKKYPGREIEFDTGALHINNSVSVTSALVKDESLDVTVAQNTVSAVEVITEVKPTIGNEENVVMANDSTDVNKSEIIVKDEKGFTKEDYNFVNNIINSEEFKELLKLSLPTEEVLIATLIFHGYRGKTFSVNEAATFLNTTPEDIINIARKVLNAYKDLVDSKLDMYEQFLKEQAIKEQQLKKTIN